MKLRRRLLWIALAIVILVAGWSATTMLLASSRQNAFMHDLRHGQSLAAVQAIAAAHHVGPVQVSRTSQTSVVVPVAQTWRFGTRCEDVREVLLVFADRRLVRWIGSSGSVCS